MAKIHFDCIGCGQSYALDSSYEGRAIDCICGLKMTVPAASGAPTSPRQQFAPQPAALVPAAPATPTSPPAPPQPAHVRRRRRLARVLGIVLAVPVGCVVGFFSAHHFALYGGLYLIGRPYSPARDALVPGHMLLWSLLLALVGFGVGHLIDTRDA